MATKFEDVYALTKGQKIPKGQRLQAGLFTCRTQSLVEEG